MQQFLMQCQKTCKVIIYHLKTNEIPGELSREIMTSLHLKITCYLHMCKDHRCYGYIINADFHGSESEVVWD